MNTEFGFYVTATHLRCDGLLFGVWMSYLNVHHPKAWASFRRGATWLLLRGRGGRVLGLVVLVLYGAWLVYVGTYL